MTLVIDTCNLTVVEGNTPTVVLTLTNGTASDVAINNFAGGAPSFAGTGDPSDRFRNFVIDPDNCRSMTPAAGKSCLLPIDYITDSDFGLNQWNLCAEVAGQPKVYTGEYFLSIQDAPVTSPEPSSLRTGFVGLFGSLRRRMLWR